MLLAFFVLLSALSLSATAAYYSIVGLIAIFSGASLAVAVMAGAMEAGKVVAVLWLHKHWVQSGRLLKYALSTAVVILMLITSMGIYGFLSSAYLKASANFEQDYISQSFIQQQIELIDEDIARNENIIKQLDNSVDSLIALNQVTRGLNARRAQEKERTEIRNEIARLQEEKKKLNASLLESKQKVAVIEAEVGPVKYIAELVFGNSESKEVLDKAVRLVILLLIFVFDPLAVLLLIAAQKAYQFSKEEKSKVLETVTEVESVEPIKETFVDHQQIDEHSLEEHVEEKIEEELSESQSTIRERIKKKKERNNSTSQM